MRIIERLSPGEIGKAIRFANRQFGTDFLWLQPKLYRHPVYGDTYVCAENTEICGMLSVYPYRYHGLHCLSIGTVCTAPEYRGQGIMRNLFAHLETHVFPQFDLLTLTGKKRLYEQFGFAKAVCFPEYRYIPEKGTPFDRVIQIQGHEADDVLYSLYSKFGVGVSRSKDSFAELLNGNGRNIYLLQHRSDMAYVSCDQAKRRVLEICGTLGNEQIVAALAQIWGSGDITILGKTNQLDRQLAESCDGYILRNHGNIRINHPEHVLPALGFREEAAAGNPPLSLEETYRIFGYGAHSLPQCVVPSSLWYMDGI